MRDLLRGSLGRSLSALDDVDRLATAWPVVCGRAMAEHGEIVAFVEGVVHVQVSSGPWLRQMMSTRGQLQHELARVASVAVTGIHFEMKQSRNR
jgi:hypothetical protein